MTGSTLPIPAMQITSLADSRPAHGRRGRLRRATALLLALALGPAAMTTTASVAQAQGPQGQAAKPQNKAYQEHVERAVQEFQLGNYAEARALFLRAHNIRPNARTSRGLGLTEFELKNYPQAITYLRAALASKTKPLSQELRASTETIIERAESYIGRYQLALRPEPEAFRVLVDGQHVKPGPGQELLLSVGERHLDVRAAGYKDAQRTVSVQGGERATLNIELRPLLAAGGAPQAAPSAAMASAQTDAGEDDSSILSSPWLWTGAAALVIGGVVAVIALSGSDSGSDPSEFDDADLVIPML